MPTQKKILINCPSILDITNKNNNSLGGIESLCLVLANELSKRKFNITFSCINKKKIQKGKILYVSINEIKKKFKNYNFDSIISANDASIFSYYKQTEKQFFWLHNKLQIEKSIRKKQFLSIIKNRLNVVFVSNYLKNITSNLYFFKKKFVIKNFLLPNFKNNKVRIKRKPIFIWSVQREKGLSDFINIWINQVYNSSKSAKFYIFGIDKIPNNLNKKFLKSKNIFFKGRVSKKKLKKTYNESMGMVCLGYDETFCLNALEANACGLPVITLGKTVLKDYVINNFNGYIVNNFSDIALKIKYLIKLKSRKKIIQNSISTSKKYYLDTIIHDWLKLLK
jgi:glycosyltransferase involved in cell wall biosynthesis